MSDLAAYLISAPRGGQFSLQQRCLWTLRGHFVDLIDKMIDRHTMDLMDNIVGEIKASILAKVFDLPTCLVQSVIDHTCSADNTWVQLAVACAVLSLPEPRQHDLKIKIVLSQFIRLDVFLDWIPRFGPGLVELEAKSDLLFDDDMLLQLASSTSAGSLKKLIILSSRISDASASAWSHFTALEVLDLSSGRKFGFKTLESMSLLSTLQTLSPRYDGRLDLSIEQVEDLFASERLPQLKHLSINLEDLMYDEDSKQRLLTLFESRPNLEDLYLSAESEEEVDVESYAQLPQLTGLVAPVEMGIEKILELLPHIPNFRQLSIREWDSEITEEHLESIASCCPSLEALSIDVGNEASLLSTDFRIFSSLTSLDVGYHNYFHANTGFPISLTSLHLGIHSEEDFSEELLQTLRQSICALSNLKTLYINTNKPLITQSSFPTFFTNLSSLQDLTISQDAAAAPSPIKGTLGNLPYLTDIRFDVSNLEIGSIYLPAIRNTEPASSFPLFRYTPAQLPNLDTVGSREYERDDEERVLEFLRQFGPQLNRVNGLPEKLPFTEVCKWSKMETLDIYHPISCDSAKDLLQNLRRLRSLSVAIDVTLPDLSWLKHEKLTLLRLTLISTEAGPDPSLHLAASDTPSLSSLVATLSKCRKASMKIFDLRNLRTFTVVSRSIPDRTQVSFEISSCPLVARASFNSIEFASFEIKNMKITDLFLTRVRFPGADRDTSSLMDLTTQEFVIAGYGIPGQD